MKFKVIEGQKFSFERELNAFVSDKSLVIIDIKYSTATPKSGYDTVHSALVHYEEDNH